MNYKQKSLLDIPQTGNQWSSKKYDRTTQDIDKSMGIGDYQLFNEFPVPDHKKNWVQTESEIKNLHCPDTYFDQYNKCLQKTDKNRDRDYYFVDNYYSAQDHTLMTDDNKRLKGPTNPRQDYVVLKYQNKLNPNHYSKQSVLTFKDKYQNLYKQKLQQNHDLVQNPILYREKQNVPLTTERYRWKENGVSYGYDYTIWD